MHKQSTVEYTNKPEDMSYTHIHEHMETLQMNKMNIQQDTKFYFGNLCIILYNQLNLCIKQYKNLGIHNLVNK